MRVTHLSPTFWHPDSLVGGAERYVWELARAEAALGADVQLVSFVRTRATRGSTDGVSWIGLPLPPILAERPLAVNSWRAFALVQGARVLHVHQIHTPLTARAVYVSKLLGKKVVLTDHNGGAPLGPLGRRLVRHADRYAFVSQLSRRQFPWVPDSRQTVVYGGVDAERFRPVPEGPRRGVLFVGRPLQGKGLSDLVQAIHGEIHVTLALAGKEDPGAVRRLGPASGQVSVVWNPSTDHLAELYRGAEVLALPATSPEVLSLVVLEALACGTPVVISDLVGVREVVGDSWAVRTVPAGDPAALRRALDEFLGVADRETLHRAARAVALANSWEGVARRCLDIYSAL